MVENLKKVDSIILSRQYPFFRLLDVNRTTLIPYKRITLKKPEHYFKHWNFVKHKLTDELPNGHYILECFYDVARKYSYEYNLEKKDGEDTSEPVVIMPPPPNLSDKSNQNEKVFMNEKETIEMIKENAQLKAQVELLMREVDYLKKENLELETELSECDLGEEETQGGLMGGLNALIPILTPLAEKFIEQQDRRLDLEQQKLNRNSQPKSLSPANFGDGSQRRINRMASPQAQDENEAAYQDILSEMVGLYSTSPETFDMEMDALMQNAPDTYNRIMQDMRLEDGGDFNEAV